MTVSEKTRWKNWADELRQEMMSTLTAEVTKSVETITFETATSKAESTLRSVRFWQSCQAGKSPNESSSTAGFEIDFQHDGERNVQEVTLRLNPTWMTILQGVLDRKNG